MSEKSAGYELIRDRERLENLHPNLAARYQSFLRSFAQFREMQKQFDGQSRRQSTPQGAFTARLK